MGHIVTSWAYEAAGATERFSVVGSQGSLWSDGTTLWHKQRGGQTVEEKFEPVDTIPAEVADFGRRVTAGERPIHTEVEGIDVLKVILGAYASADEGRTVRLQD